jgi:hypothetical protein
MLAQAHPAAYLAEAEMQAHRAHSEAHRTLLQANLAAVFSALELPQARHQHHSEAT